MLGLIVMDTDIKAQTVGMLFPKKTEDTVKNILKFNPIGVRYGNANISYERYLGGCRSITVGASTSSSIFLKPRVETTFAANMGIRQYLSKKKGPLEGMYLETQLTFSNSRYDYNSDWSTGSFYSYRSKAMDVGANFLVGKQVISRKGLTLDLYTGLGVKYSVMNSQTFTQSGSSKSYYEGPSLHIPLGLKIGFGW